MAGMNDMLADIIKRAIPPEVMQLLTAEKMQEFGERANAFVTNINQSLENIEAQNIIIISNCADILSKLEGIKNDNSNRNSAGRGKRPVASDKPATRESND